MTKYVNIDLRQPARRTLTMISQICHKNLHCDHPCDRHGVANPFVDLQGGRFRGFAINIEEEAFKMNCTFPKGHFSGE